MQGSRFTVPGSLPNSWMSRAGRGPDLKATKHTHTYLGVWNSAYAFTHLPGCRYRDIFHVGIYGSLFRDARFKASDVWFPSIGLKMPRMIYGYFKFQVRWDQPSLSILVSAQPRLVQSAAMISEATMHLAAIG